MAKLNEGVKFDEVARTFSEDKARQGELPQHESLGDEKLMATLRGLLGMEIERQFGSKV